MHGDCVVTESVVVLILVVSVSPEVIAVVVEGRVVGITEMQLCHTESSLLLFNVSFATNMAFVSTAQKFTETRGFDSITNVIAQCTYLTGQHCPDIVKVLNPLLSSQKISSQGVLMHSGALL